MSFAGHALNAIKMIKANRALLKKKSFFNDAAFDPKWDKSKSFNLKVPTKVQLKANRERNLAYLEREKLKSRFGLIAAICIVLILITIFSWVI